MYKRQGLALCIFNMIYYFHVCVLNFLFYSSTVILFLRLLLHSCGTAVLEYRAFGSRFLHRFQRRRRASTMPLSLTLCFIYHIRRQPFFCRCYGHIFTLRKIDYLIFFNFSQSKIPCFWVGKIIAANTCRWPHG